MWFTFRSGSFARAVWLAWVFGAGAAFAETCTYQTWDWDPVQRKAVDLRRVSKSRETLTPEERGVTAGCSVCEQDQAEVRVGALAPFRICRVFRERVERALTSALDRGFVIESVTGYRVGRSKGQVGADGRRTEFSNHSFGIALDVNAERNGLYDSCVHFGPDCRLIRGGEYRKGEPGAIDPDTAIYRALRAEGFRWGGELPGKQKDFMHFSPSGS